MSRRSAAPNRGRRALVQGTLVRHASPSSAFPHIERPTLNELLDTSASGGRICLVLGAAGWGKTAMLTAWAADRRVAWLAPASPAAPPRLGRELAAALAPYVPAISSSGLHRGNDEGACLALCKSLDAALDDELVLVIDDLQERIRSRSAARFIACLCRHAPDRLHLILASRAAPPFSLERLRGQGLVTEIDATRLGFTRTEVADVLDETLGPDAVGLTDQVLEATGGWPAAVRFAIDELRGVEPDNQLGVLDQLARPGGRLATYLAAEVLPHEMENARELLRDVVILGESELAIYRALGFEDPAALLGDLTRRGLVQSSPGQAESWSAIRPVHDFIEEETGHRSSLRTELHRRAAHFFVARGAHGEALRHLLAAQDHSAAAALLGERGMGLVEAGEVDTVLAAATLPWAYLDEPRIQQILGHARQVRGQWAGALEHFNRASRGTERLPPALAANMLQIAQARGEVGEALAIFDRAELADEDTVDESLLLALAATSFRMVGDYERCRELVSRAMAAAERCDDPHARCVAYTVLAMLAAAEGDPRGTEAYSVSALDAATVDSLQILRIRADRAFHLLERGLPRAAEEAAQEAVELSEACGYAVLHAIALTIRGGARATLGRLAEACEDFDASRDVFQSIGSRYVAWPLCGLGYVHRVRGDLARARAAYEEALALAEPTHEVIGLSAALVGLARVRAADDLATARELADRAVTLGEGLREVEALLTRGWVAMMAGDRETAAADAKRAAAAARSRRDLPGLAEALVLTALTGPAQTERFTLLDEASRLWREIGSPLGEAQTRLVSARLSGQGSRPLADLAEQFLREHGVHPGSERAAGPLALLRGTAPSAAIHSLGVFSVYRNGEPVSAASWQSKKARDLLKILVARRGRPVPREQLMELLWPAEDPLKAANRLSVLLSTVRGVFDPDRQADASPIVADRGSARLDLDQVEVDVEHFLTLAQSALDTHREGKSTDVIARLVAAEAQYGGVFLEEDPYESWAMPLREEARASYIAVLRLLARRLGEAGDIDRAVRYTLRLLEQDCYDEAAHLGFIRLLLAAGRRGEAKRRYDIYSAQMREIGVEPRPEPAASLHSVRLSGGDEPA
ncbi:MAG TPA: tetratricopeptide repeat protein [Mycobacteriales bacterium]|nr:tetratricopeptide repeat protein [Mycobacteriales bacterium]